MGIINANCENMETAGCDGSCREKKRAIDRDSPPLNGVERAIDDKVGTVDRVESEFVIPWSPPPLSRLAGLILCG